MGLVLDSRDYKPKSLFLHISAIRIYGSIVILLKSYKIFGCLCDVSVRLFYAYAQPSTFLGLSYNSNLLL